MALNTYTMGKFFGILSLFLAVSLVLISCADEPESGIVLREAQYLRLLSGDSARTWVMNERFDFGGPNCESNKLLTFIGVGKRLFIDLDTAVCIDSIRYQIEQGTWDLKMQVGRRETDSLVFRIQNDSLFVRVHLITSQFLDISYHLRSSEEDSVLIREFYTPF